jgi:hypothetical protein
LGIGIRFFAVYPAKSIILRKCCFWRGIPYYFFRICPISHQEAGEILLLEGIRGEFISIYPKWFKEKDKLGFVELISKNFIVTTKGI